MHSAVPTTRAFGFDWQSGRRGWRAMRSRSEDSLTFDRLAYRRQQLGAREWLRQNVTHRELTRQGARRARAPSKCRGEKQYRARMRVPHGVDNALGSAGRRHVDDDQARFSSVASRLGQDLRGSGDNAITCLAQPALE